MSNLEDMEGLPPAKPFAPIKSRTSRCYQCNGHFGLVRRWLGLKQFCSTRCLNRYKADIYHTTTRVKEWALFLYRKL
jgi:hypothetical protein